MRSCLEPKEKGCLSGITLDAGGLFALDRNGRRVITLCARAKDRRMRVTIPATALHKRCAPLPGKFV